VVAIIWRTSAEMPVCLLQVLGCAELMERRIDKLNGENVSSMELVSGRRCYAYHCVLTDVIGCVLRATGEGRHGPDGGVGCLHSQSLARGGYAERVALDGMSREVLHGVCGQWHIQLWALVAGDQSCAGQCGRCPADQWWPSHFI
jgi:hypothetical protein